MSIAPRIERFNKLSLFYLTFLLVAMLFSGRAMAEPMPTATPTPIPFCNDTVGQHLPTPGSADTDLLVTGPCEVKGGATAETAGSYTFHNVNILGGGSLSFDDAQINF